MINLKSLNKSLLNLKQQYVSLTSQRNSLASDVDKYKKRLKDLDKQKRKLSTDTEIDSINQDIKIITEKKSEAEKSLFMVDQKLSGKVGSVTQKFNSLIDALQVSIKEEEASLEQISEKPNFFNSKKIALAKKELADLKSQKSEIEHQTPSVEDLENQRNKLLRDNPMVDLFYLESIDSQIAELKQKQSKIDNSISNKESEISILHLLADESRKNPEAINLNLSQLATLKKAIKTIQIPEKSSPEALSEGFDTISNVMNSVLHIEQSDKKTDKPENSINSTNKSINETESVISNKDRIKAAMRIARDVQHKKIQEELKNSPLANTRERGASFDKTLADFIKKNNLSDALAQRNTSKSNMSKSSDINTSNPKDTPKSNVSKSPDTSASSSKDAPKSNVSKSPDTSASGSKDAPKSNTSELPDVPKKGFLKKAIYAALTVLIIGAGILGFKSFKNKAENNKQTKQEQENEMGNSNNDDSSINVDEVDSITVNEEGQIINTENKSLDSNNAEYETDSDISIDGTESTSSENTSNSESTPTTYQNNEYYYDQFTQQTNIALEEAQNYLEQSNKEKDSDKKKEDIYNAAQSLKVALENEKSVNYHTDGNKDSNSSSISTSQVYSEVVDKLTETFNNYQADLEDIDKQIQENQDKLDELNQHNSNSVEAINSIQTYTADISNLKKQKDAIESDLESVSNLLKDLPLQEQEPVTNNDSSQSTTTSQNKSKDFRDSQVVIQPLFDIGSPCVISSDITLYGDSEETPSKGHYAFENPTQVQICAFAAVSKKTGFYDHNSRSMTLYNIQKAYPSDDYIIMALLGRPGFDYEDRKGWYGWTSYQKLADSQNKNMWNDINKDNISAQYIDNSISFR